MLFLDFLYDIISTHILHFISSQVDRSVTGLIAQQQCVGPLHTPLADVAVTALSYWDTRGAATAIGEQPIKTLVSAECGARMSVGESLTNLSFALITHLKVILKYGVCQEEDHHLTPHPQNTPYTAIIYRTNVPNLSQNCSTHKKTI